MKILKILLAVVAFLAIALVVYGSMNSPFTVETRVTVDRSVEQAWGVFAAEDKLTEWITGLEKIEFVDGAETEAVGNTYRLYFNEDGRETIVEEKVTAYVPNERMAFTIDHEMMYNETDIRFNSLGDQQCEVISVSKTEGKGMFMKGLMALSKSSIVERQQADYDKLKALIEAEPPMEMKPEVSADSSLMEG
ncbi:MAG: SRPBCC family protein [Calditrichia bacterium]